MSDFTRPRKRWRFQHRAVVSPPEVPAPHYFPPEDQDAAMVRVRPARGSLVVSRIAPVSAVGRLSPAARALSIPRVPLPPAPAPISVAPAPAGDRCDGFLAPPAYPEDLPANPTGWLIGVGSVPRRLLPRAMPLKWFTPLIPLGPGVAGLLFERDPGFAVCLLLGLAPLVTATQVVNLAAGVRLRRQRAAAIAVDRPDDLAACAGSLVRVRGTIAEQPTFPSLFRGRPAVVARSRVGAADETRGIDFSLTLRGGYDRVRVHVRGAIVLDRPTRLSGPPACDPVTCEWSDWTARLRPHLPAALPLRHRLFPPRLHEIGYGPGDAIEVCGQLQRETAPDGAAAPGRGTPLAWSIRSAKDAPVLLRKI